MTFCDAHGECKEEICNEMSGDFKIFNLDLFKFLVYTIFEF